MRVDLFDFDLPEDLIALRPARPRDAARLLVVEPAMGDPATGLTDAFVSNLPDLLRPGDALVLNDTRVIAAELSGVRARRARPAKIIVTLISQGDRSHWLALARPAKRLVVGDRLRFGALSDNAGLDATVAEKGEGGEVVLAFDLCGPVLDEAIAAIAAVPLPPYITGRRQADDFDRRDYQTVFARVDGAVAAPTAGLHFTESLFARLDDAGIGCRMVTLHVGPGTFRPVSATDTDAHSMVPERGTISAETAETLNTVRAEGGRIVAVGTTSLRLIETAADEAGVIHPFAGETSLFITPGYRFRAVDLLMTNFHLPRSTLFMLVSAFCGRQTIAWAYAHAVGAGYRFYSYGDACLLYPETS